jgi:tetratricopeptide (TPR) repeat protein
MSSKATRKSVGVMNQQLAVDVKKLADWVKWRKIPRALECIEKWLPLLPTMPLFPEMRRNAIRLLAYCAWGIDYDNRFFDPVKAAVARFKQKLPKDLTRTELAHLAIAEGLLTFHQEKYREAEVHFQTAHDHADHAEDQELMIVSRYYRGRALAKCRLYDRGLELINDAIERDLNLNNNYARVAAMEAVKSWLLFLKGRFREAQAVLEQARKRLGSVKDYVVDRGNIVGALGRYHLQGGEYQRALDCFSEAIEILEDHNPAFRNVPRTLINKAFTLRLLARDLGEQLPSKDEHGISDNAQKVEKFRELLSQAFAALDRAAVIYEFDKSRDMHFHEISKLHSIRALLHYDQGHMREAESEAEKAFDSAAKGRDNIGMANARGIQSKLALDGDITDFVDAPSALEYAREAISYAKTTENRRALARACMHAARALTHSPYNDSIEADQYLREAQRQLVPEDRDYLRASISSLEKVIDQCAKRRNPLRISSITMGRLQELMSAGLSLKEITAEHEQRIIRSVYKSLGGNLNETRRQLRTGIRKIKPAIAFFEINEKGLEKLASEGIAENVLATLALWKHRRIQGTATFTIMVSLTLKPHQSKIVKRIVKTFECSTDSL